MIKFNTQKIKRMYFKPSAEAAEKKIGRVAIKQNGQVKYPYVLRYELSGNITNGTIAYIGGTTVAYDAPTTVIQINPDSGYDQPNSLTLEPTGSATYDGGGEWSLSGITEDTLISGECPASGGGEPTEYTVTWHIAGATLKGVHVYSQDVAEGQKVSYQGSDFSLEAGHVFPPQDSGEYDGVNYYWDGSDTDYSEFETDEIHGTKDIYINFPQETIIAEASQENPPLEIRISYPKPKADEDNPIDLTHTYDGFALETPPEGSIYTIDLLEVTPAFPYVDMPYISNDSGTVFDASISFESVGGLDHTMLKVEKAVRNCKFRFLLEG